MCNMCMLEVPEIKIIGFTVLPKLEYAYSYKGFLREFPSDDKIIIRYEYYGKPMILEYDVFNLNGVKLDYENLDIMTFIKNPPTYLRLVSKKEDDKDK